MDTSTEFSWTPIDGSIAVFSAAAIDTQILVITGRSTVHLPDLGTYGVSLPTGTSIAGGVFAFGPWSNLDAFAGVGTLNAIGPTSFERASVGRHFSVR